MDQIILKYIDKQNYFFLNYFEKKVFNLNNDFLGFFCIKNDSLQITWNNKLIEEFIFHTKNNELINIYKNINENNTNININHKKWSLKLIINNNTNQIFNSLDKVYGIVQKINNTTIKINWQHNIYEHDEIEEFILNLENNNYYLIEDIPIKIDFKKMYIIKYLKGSKIINKKILIDKLYNIIYDLNNLNIIGSYKIIENKYYIQSNLLNECIFSKINGILYSEIILKYIYKLIIIENNKFYLYKKNILNVNNIAYNYNIEYNYDKNIIIIFINDKQYVYDLYTLKDLTSFYIKEIILKNELKEEYYKLNLINNKLFSLINNQYLYNFEIKNNYLTIKFNDNNNNNNNNNNNDILYYFEKNTNTYILNKLLEKKEHFFHKDWKKLCILDKDFIYKDNDKGKYHLNNNKIVVEWELWNKEIFYKYNSIFYSDIFFYDIIIDNYDHRYKIFNLFNLILDENFITIYKVEFVEDKIKLITENNVEFFNYELQDNTYILYSKKYLNIQLVNDNNFYYLYKDLCLFTKNNIINPVAKVITIKNNKLIIQYTNDCNDINDKTYIYLSKSKNIYYLESLKIENIILIDKDKSIHSLILDNIEKKLKCDYFEKNIIKNKEELLLFDNNNLNKYSLFYDNIYIEENLLNDFKKINFNLDIAYIFDHFKTNNKFDSLKHFLNNELLIYSFNTFNKKYLTLNNLNFNNLKYYFEILYNNIDNNINIDNNNIDNNNIDNNSNCTNNNKLIIINCIDINDLSELNKFLFENKKDKDYLVIIINKDHIFKQTILNLKNYYNNLIIFENNIIKNSSIFYFIYYYIKKYNLLFYKLIYIINDDYKIENKNNLNINKMNKNILLFIKNKYDFTFLILSWYLKNYNYLDLDNINFEINRINFFDLFNIF
jgi:hypothetical protein